MELSIRDTNDMKTTKPTLILLFIVALAAQAQLAVTVLPMTGQRAIVSLAMKNDFAERTAVIFPHLPS